MEKDPRSAHWIIGELHRSLSAAVDSVVHLQGIINGLATVAEERDAAYRACDGLKAKLDESMLYKDSVMSWRSEVERLRIENDTLKAELLFAASQYRALERESRVRYCDKDEANGLVYEPHGIPRARA